MSIKKGLLKAMTVAPLFIVLSFGEIPAPSQGAESKNMDRLKIVYDGERSVHPGYPRLFDCVGQIDRLTNRQIVIDDSLLRISSNASYHTPAYFNAQRSRFHVGDVVGCLMNSKGEIESIWLIITDQH